MLKVSSRLFPIGYIIQVDAPNFNPNNFYDDGNWERIKGRVIVGVDEVQIEFNTTGKIGGAKTHYHQFNSMPSEGTPPPWEPPSQRFLYRYSKDNPHQFTIGTGGEKDSNLQPYQTAFVWKLISYSN